MSESNDTPEEIELPPRPKRYSTETGVLINQVPGRCNTWSETTEDMDGNEIDAREFLIYADEVERQLKAALSANREKEAALEELRLWASLGGPPIILDGKPLMCQSNPKDIHVIHGSARVSLKNGEHICEIHAIYELEEVLASLRASVDGEKWIDVKQELPEPGVNVLAIICGYSHSSQHYTVYRTEPLTEDGFYTWRDSHYGNQSLWFTHWQPLPAPPSLPTEKE